jgi:radical SAM protein with 4Fe4S-binding SPASM domain
LEFIPQDAGYLMYCHQTQSIIPVSAESKQLLETCPEKAPFSAYLQIYAQQCGKDETQVLSELVSFIKTLIQAGLLSVDNPIEARDWKACISQETNASRVCYLSVSHRCNLQCLYCYNAKERETGLKAGCAELTDAEICRLIESLAETSFEYLIFTGGEPLMRESLFDLASYARLQGLEVNLLTNGTLIDQHNASDISRQFESIIVSLDSVLKAEHDRLRGRGSYSQVVKGLRHLADTGKQNISLRPVITRHNIENLHMMPSVAFKEWHCSSFQPTMYLPNTLEEDDVLGLLPDITIYQRSMDHFYTALAMIPGGQAENPLESISYGGKCGMARSIISISADGNVYPCQSLHYPELTMGNIRKSDLPAILAQGASLDVIGASGLDVDVCCNCNYLMICGGGCRATAYKLYGNVRAFNELMCPYSKAEAQIKLLRYYEYRQNQLTNK